MRQRDPEPRESSRYDAVLFDRDGTLVHDVAYNGDPAAVRPVAGARAALDRLRAAGLRLGVVTNQSGLARGCFTTDDMAAVHARITALLGPFDTWQVCPHDETAGCACRKPRPGMVRAAARDLGTVAGRCVVVGDIGRDMVAATAAGADGILVPTPVTRSAEIAGAPAVAGDLAGAVHLILRRQRLLTGQRAGAARPGRRVLAVRADSVGDVLLTGPAIRAIAARAAHVTLLCAPQGRAAAELLPGVDEIIEHGLPWIDPAPAAPVDPTRLARLAEEIAVAAPDEALIFTSFHQSALPLALLLRLVGVGRISAVSDDYPGSLLDLRHRPPLALPEPERACSLAAAAGYPLPPGDDGTLRVHPDATGATGSGPPDDGTGGFVVVHPGANVPARACPPRRCAEIVEALAAAGHRVLVTGSPGERDLTATVAGRHGIDLGGRTTLAGLAALLRRAACAVVGNTGPAHLAAAVGTPVVSLFAPTVSFTQWAPYRVPHVRLGDATAACRHTRAAHCPLPGHPCLARLAPDGVVEAVRLLTAGRELT